MDEIYLVEVKFGNNRNEYARVTFSYWSYYMFHYVCERT